MRVDEHRAPAPGAGIPVASIARLSDPTPYLHFPGNTREALRRNWCFISGRPCRIRPSPFVG
jgi:hypothetical protein